MSFFGFNNWLLYQINLLLFRSKASLLRKAFWRQNIVLSGQVAKFENKNKYFSVKKKYEGL